jgi:glucose-6-phosphate isomerase
VINSNYLFTNNINSKNIKSNSVKILSKKFDKIFLEIKKDIKKSNKIMNVLNKNYKFNFNTKDLIKFKKFQTIVIIGMGGSILGAEAIYNIFKNKIKKDFHFFNDLDEEKITNFKKRNLSKVLFIIISKSGNTIETLSNTFSLNIIKKNSKNIIIVSEKKNNFLFALSKKLNLFYIEHKNYIGGRFSVLSEVGMLPAYLMGLNIFKLRSKILNCLRNKNKYFLKSSTIKLADLINKQKIYSLVFLNYYPELEKFLYWAQQLIAESLGKKKKGLLPVISNAPKDHHSLLQLYLDGPKDKVFNIFYYKKKSTEKVVIENDLKIKSYLNKKNLSTIKDAQKMALIKSFKKNNIPFREFRIKNMNEEVVGELFSYFIIETIVIAKLIKINPFDQPAVEQVKIFTKKILT